MKKKRQPFVDDGRTIAEMNIDGMPWYRPDRGKKVKEEAKPTGKERRAMYRAGYLAYLPSLLASLAGLGLAVLLVWLWLHGWHF